MVDKREYIAKYPLHGLTIIDFSHYVAGPYASSILSDLGADVIKIENPNRGDNFRYYPPFDPEKEDMGGAFLWCNRNKRSVAIDLKSDEGREIVLKLISKADILLENFSTGVMDKLGLSYSHVSKLNQRLIYCSISAYGRTGPYKDRAGFDAIVQAESGFMSMNGYPDRDGVRTAASIMDVGTAMMASNAILAALYKRERSQTGEYVEVSLFDTAINMNSYTATQRLVTGIEATRNGNLGPDTCPTGVFQSQDKRFYLHCGNDQIFLRLCTEVIGDQTLSTRTGWTTNAERLKHREEINKYLQTIFECKPWTHWHPLFLAARVPAGEVRLLGEALTSSEATSSGVVGVVSDIPSNKIPAIFSPIKLGGKRMSAYKRPPRLGEHTLQVLAEHLNISADEIDELKQKNVI